MTDEILCRGSGEGRALEDGGSICSIRRFEIPARWASWAPSCSRLPGPTPDTARRAPVFRLAVCASTPLFDLDRERNTTPIPLASVIASAHNRTSRRSAGARRGSTGVNQ